jgi:spore photoproduct lyase
MKHFVPDEIWIESSERDTALSRRTIERSPDVPVRFFETGAVPGTESFGAEKRRLILRKHRGSFLQHCPAGKSGMVCCNYLVMNFASGCPLDCSYCFLQDYLADNPALQAFTNVEEALAEVGAVLRAHPQRQFRIGTGELADSLALDPLTGLSRQLVPFFAAHDNVVLELKTKTRCIEDLLDLDPRGRVVVSWSMNAETIIDSEEHRSASLSERLAAAQRVLAAGYKLGFHLDPLIEFDGWQEEYPRLVESIYSAIDPAAVAWVSLGSLRMTASLQRAVRRRDEPARAVLGAELVPGADGKVHVWRGLRTRMYRTVIESLRRAAPAVPVYLCMEPPPIWQQVMREAPADRDLGLRLAAGARW